MAAAVLYPLGARGFHHRQFDLFLGIVLGLAALIVVVFLTTSTPDAER
ncbi:MAG: hypothetical protein HYU41_22590 [Candidatus Rokubacteria bacterium]|nr:hypothetical protein [Candidatus Rokubacteria bacterium]